MIAGRDAKDVFIDALHLGMVFVAAFFSLACKNAMRSFILCFKGDPFTAYHESWGCVYLFSFFVNREISYLPQADSRGSDRKKDAYSFPRKNKHPVDTSPFFQKETCKQQA